MRKLLLTVIAVTSLMSPATAAQITPFCTVADPSDTPLNVRSQPNGQIIGALHNGTKVMIVGPMRREWVSIVPQVGKRGFVWSEYLDCEVM